MNLNFLFGYQKNNTSTTSANAAGNTLQATGPPADMTSFKAGQTIQGEVVAVKNNEIILQLEDGGQIRATLSKDIQINVGQTMTFEVKSNNGSRLSLSPLFENMGHDPNALKALSAAGMPQSARNLEMVSLLMRQGLPVDKNSLLAFNRQISANPTTNLLTLAQMNKLDIPTTPEHLRQFEAYKNYEHQISSAVRDITDGLIRDIGQIAVKGDTDNAVALFKQILNIFGSNNENAVFTSRNDGTVPVSGHGNQNIPVINSDDILRIIAEQTKAENNSNISQVLNHESQIIGQNLNLESSASNQMNMTAQAANPDAASIFDNLIADKQPPLQNIVPNQAAAFPAGAISDENINPAQAISQAVTPSQVSDAAFISLTDLTPENREQLSILLKDVGFSTELTNAVNNSTINQTTLISMINQELTQFPELIDNAKLAALFNNKDFQALIKNDINNQWLLKPEEVSIERNVEEHFKKIFEQTNKLIETLNNHGRGESTVAQSANNLSNNINFVNQLNQMFTYIQLPLKMNGENTHAELFVYTNKKNLAKNDGNVSALLHLDMEHLGSLDIHIAMQNKNINTKFYLENDRVINLVAKHVHILNDRLLDRGYIMKNEFVTREAEKRPIDEILEATKNVSVLASYSFDARA